MENHDKPVSMTSLEISERIGKDHARVLTVLTWYSKSFGGEGITIYYRKLNNRIYKTYLVREDIVDVLVLNGVLPNFKY